MLSGTLFHWCAVSGGGIILQAWCQLFANLYELKSRIWFWEEHNQ